MPQLYIPIRDEGYALVMRCSECKGIVSAAVEQPAMGAGWDDRLPIAEVRTGAWCQGCWKRRPLLERDEDGFPTRFLL